MSKTHLPDDDHDYLNERCDMLLADCVKHAEIHLSPSEQRGRWLTTQAAMEKTAMHPVIPASDEYRFWLCLGSLAMAVLAILLAGLVLAHVLLLPDATVWPLGVAAMICAGACAVTGWFGVRGLA